MAQVTHPIIPHSSETSRIAFPPVDTQSGSSGSLPTGRTTQIYPKRFPVLNSDTARQSPWSNKLLLSLDGGGIRGYSSLLIIRKLLTIVAALEKSQWPTCSSSRDYPWSREEQSGLPQQNRQPSPEANRLEVAQDNDHRSSNATNDRLSESTNVPADVETSSEATRNPSQTANLPENDLCKFRIHHYFDYIAGTSTGGLSALMLSRLKMGIDDALEQYNTVGNDVFAKPRPSVLTIRGVLKPKFGTKRMNGALCKVVEHGSEKERLRTGHSLDEIKLGNGNTDACHTAVVAYYGTPVRTPYVFRSYACPTNNKNNRRFNGDNASGVKVWKVARATSAAPLYFRAQEIKKEAFIDGGMGCNNPSEFIYSEIRAVHGKRPYLILSIGTGTKAKSVAQANHTPGVVARARNRKHKFFNNTRGVWTAVQGLPDIATDSEKTHDALENAIEVLRAANDNVVYFRFNVPGLASDVEFDEWDSDSNGSQTPNGETTLKRIRDTTNEYLGTTSVATMLDNCAKELVRVRRERAETERWERFATHTVYQCPRDDCPSPNFPSREKLRMHASEHHHFVQRITMKGKHVCLIDQCMETPRLHDGDVGFIEHLKGPDHFLEKATLKSTSELEDWLDLGRIPEETQEEANGGTYREQNGTAAQPAAVNGNDGGRGRSFLSAMVTWRRRTGSTPSEPNRLEP